MTAARFLRLLPSPAAMIRLAISVAAIVLTAWAQWAGNPAGIQLADEWMRDHIVKMQAVPEAEERILVVDLDETTLARYPWPWPRGRMADLIEQLMVDEARAIALDIVMFSPGEASGDARLAQLAAHGPLVLAQLFDYNRGNFLHEGTLIGGTRTASVGPASVATGYMANHAGLAGAAHVGNIGVILDGDGILRRVPLHSYFQGRHYPTLSLALLQCCGAKPAPTPVSGQVRVPFRRDWSAYLVAKGADVLEGRFPAEWVKGRHVLVGSSALSIGDRVSSPLGGNTAGLLVHAALMSSLLDDQEGKAPARWPGRAAAVAFVALLVVLVSYTFPRLSAISNVALLVAATAAWLVLAYVLCPHDPELSISGPLLSTLFLLTFAVPFHWQLAQRKSRQLIGTLRQYVATAVVDELLRSDLKDPLAPRQAVVTTLIADMEGYTTQVESLPVDEAARLTTDFLDCLTRPVLACHGTLDKYTGDGLVAFWGAPLPDADHADRALDAAQDIVREVAALSRLRERNGAPPLRVRIGIESGLAMAGDYGSSLRSIYTAVGDSVNTASRLEQAARDFPHDVIIGAGTVAYATRHRFKALGERLLRGKEKPLSLYTLEPDQ
jgi:adenylate cyclase